LCENRRYIAICLGVEAISTNVFQHISQSRSRCVGRVECNCLPPGNFGCVCVWVIKGNDKICLLLTQSNYNRNVELSETNRSEII